ncbi:MAG: hypothetical protein KGO94_02555 [Alphaproteobacteria bacterium]|nr:hypothetical protein [Alphaproteobacteria bacterium]
MSAQIDISQGAAQSWAIITPSYRGDYERCVLLCKSLDAFVNGPWHHYIIVETVDLVLFRPLAGPRRTILEMEALLPKSFYHLARIPIINNRSVWFSWRTGFMVGWHVQQLVKMEMAFQVQDEGLLYCDSDVFFVRPFDISNLSENGKCRFYRTEVEYPADRIPNPKYISVSARQLKLPDPIFPSPTYVENLVPWHAATVRGLCAHVAAASGRDWKYTLGREIFLSEYSLYGLYVERILKMPALFQVSNQILCKTVWNRGAMDDAALSDFFSEVPPPIVALGVQSFVGIAVSRLEQQFDLLLKKAKGAHS